MWSPHLVEAGDVGYRRADVRDRSSLAVALQGHQPEVVYRCIARHRRSQLRILVDDDVRVSDKSVRCGRPTASCLQKDVGYRRADVRDRSSLAVALQGSEVVYNLAAVHRDDVKPISLR